MKKFLLSIYMIFAVVSILAAQAKRYVMIEHFTNSRCSSCGAVNPGFYNVLKGYTGKYHHLSVHPSFPYSNCALYQANTAENTARANYYTINSTPTVVVRGINKKSASQVNTTLMNAEISLTSPIELRVIETGTTNRTASVEIKTVGTKPSGSYKIFAAIAEKQLDFASPNGEKIHYDVFRKFASATEGDLVTLAPEGNSTTVNFNYNVASTWVEGQTYLLVWIQDIATKEVLNSGSRYDGNVTSIEDAALPSFKIYPNPVKDQINVKFDSNIPANTSVIISSLIGREIKTSKIKAGISQFNLNVNEVPKGIYFIRFNMNGKTITRKWYKE